MGSFYPVFLQIKDKHCVIVGGGEVAARKASSLLASDARVVVVSPQICGELLDLSGHPQLQLVHREINEHDLDGAYLVIAATNNTAVNRQVAQICQGKRILCNIVDAPRLSSFIVPSVIRQGPLTIAVSTGGKAPAAAKQIRVQLETEFDEAYAAVLELLGQARSDILQQVEDSKLRRKMLTALQLDELLDLYRTNGQAGIERRIKEIMDFK